jgi:hypothetical protein
MKQFSKKKTFFLQKAFPVNPNICELGVSLSGAQYRAFLADMSPGANTLTYFVFSSVTTENSLKTLTPVACTINVLQSS